MILQLPCFFLLVLDYYVDYCPWYCLFNTSNIVCGNVMVNLDVYYRFTGYGTARL